MLRSLENELTKPPRSRGAVVAASLAVLTLGMSAATASAAVDPQLQPFYMPTVAQVPERTASDIAVFRQTNPVTPPPEVQLSGAVDTATGQSLFGMNAVLARPAYPSGVGPGKPHYWLVPAAEGRVAAIEFDGKGREVTEGGFMATVNRKFERYGFVVWDLIFLGAKSRTTIRGLMPDSIKKFKLITRRSGKKPLTKTYKIRDNTILLRVKSPTYIVLKGKKIRITPTRLREEDLGDGVEIGN